jgi:hypothetical protein
MAYNYRIPENGHVVNVVPPVDINGTGATGDYVNLGKYHHIDIIIQAGVTGAASTVTVNRATSAAGAGAVAIPFDYYSETTDAGDTLSTKNVATSAGFATSTNNNIMYVISVDSASLTDGFPWINIAMSDPGQATVVSAVAVLNGARYAQDTTPTAIV